MGKHLTMRNLVDGEKVRKHRQSRSLTRLDIDCEISLPSESSLSRIEPRNTRENRIAMGIENTQRERLQKVVADRDLRTLWLCSKSVTADLAQWMRLRPDQILTHWVESIEPGRTLLRPVP